MADLFRLRHFPLKNGKGAAERTDSKLGLPSTVALFPFPLCSIHRSRNPKVQRVSHRRTKADTRRLLVTQNHKDYAFHEKSQEFDLAQTHEILRLST